MMRRGLGLHSGGALQQLAISALLLLLSAAAIAHALDNFANCPFARRGDHCAAFATA